MAVAVLSRWWPLTPGCVGCRRASRLVYAAHGPPDQVLKYETFPTPVDVPDPQAVLVRMLMSPVHPADVNAIQGTYPIRPDLPAVGGGEGLGVVQKVGGAVVGLQKGDWVLPARNMAGTWTTHATGPARDFVKIRPDISMEGAATLRSNPGTAWRMLQDFARLEPGDVVLQNGSNSAVGQAVIQMARHWQWRTVNIVRDREDIDELKQDLTAKGADVVLTEAEFRQWPEIREGRIPPAKLALNCVGGASATELARSLATSGVLVTYGGMSLKPVTVTTSSLIFRDIVLRGFWYSRWLDQVADSEERSKMFAELAKLSHEGILTPPNHTKVRLKDFKMAVEGTLQGFKTGKFIFDMSAEHA